MQPQISPPIRVLSGCLSLFMLWAAWTGTLGGLNVDLLVVTGSFALASGWIALFGWNDAVIDPDPSERFRELADPSRPLPADDDAPGREWSSGGRPVTRPASRVP
ncbi:MAG TPA: hypothetical protein VFS20_13520 [Longimicrobium sp.]|nr:hypothetical protein [Longimicrobium sp.]